MHFIKEIYWWALSHPITKKYSDLVWLSCEETTEIRNKQCIDFGAEALQWGFLILFVLQDRTNLGHCLFLHGWVFIIYVL